MSNILIKFATRGRPEWFKKAIVNILGTKRTRSIIILVTADEDDPTMNNDDIRKFVERYFSVVIIYGKSESKIHAINRDIDQMGNWDILINMSDDMMFIVDGWDDIMVKMIQEVWGDSLDFFAHFNDGYIGDKLASMSIIGKTYYERDNYIYYPEYKSFSSDAEAWFVARARGRHHYFPEVLFLHQHPTWTPRSDDETYRRNSLATPHDLEVYWRRLNSNFGLEIEGHTLWDEFKTKKP